MREYLEKLPKEIKDLIYLARDTAVRKRMPAYLVGGFVRDLILGVENLDLDIVVEGDGIKFSEELARPLKAKLIRHRRFGTATLILKSRHKIDIATSRKEAYPEPAQLPVVSPGSLRDDLFRRDFTINAMAISIADHELGKLIDYFGGKEDLSREKVRVLHGLSFIDDPTRILRAVRFEQRYDFKMDQATLKLIREAVKKKMLERVEPQRIRDDLVLILKERSPLKEIRRIRQLSGFGFIHPKLKASAKTSALFGSIEREISSFKKRFPHRRHLDSWLIYLMGLLDALEVPAIREICRSFAFRKGEEKRILSFKEIKTPFISRLCKAGLLPSEVYSMLEPLSYEVIVLLKAKYGNKVLGGHIDDFLDKYSGTRIHINGDDLRRMGLIPGPRYQKIFQKVLAARLDGRVKSKEDELALAQKLVCA